MCYGARLLKNSFVGSATTVKICLRTSLEEGLFSQRSQSLRNPRRAVSPVSAEVHLPTNWMTPWGSLTTLETVSSDSTTATKRKPTVKSPAPYQTQREVLKVNKLTSEYDSSTAGKTCNRLYNAILSLGTQKATLQALPDDNPFKGDAQTAHGEHITDGDMSSPSMPTSCTIDEGGGQTPSGVNMSPNQVNCTTGIPTELNFLVDVISQQGDKPMVGCTSFDILSKCATNLRTFGRKVTGILRNQAVNDLRRQINATCIQIKTSSNTSTRRMATPQPPSRTRSLESMSSIIKDNMI